MIFLHPKAFKKSNKVSKLENDRRGFVTLSDHCALYRHHFTSQLHSPRFLHYYVIFQKLILFTLEKPIRGLNRVLIGKPIKTEMSLQKLFALPFHRLKQKIYCTWMFFLVKSPFYVMEKGLILFLSKTNVQKLINQIQ